jgi:hypothetical protein
VQIAERERDPLKALPIWSNGSSTECQPVIISHDGYLAFVKAVVNAVRCGEMDPEDGLKTAACSTGLNR